jgi:hypothetical protein
MHPPLFNVLNHLIIDNFSGHDREMPPRGRDGHDHEARARPCDHDRVRWGLPRGSARGDVRAGAREHARVRAHACAPCRHDYVHGSAHASDHARADACARAFLPLPILLVLIH